MKSLKLILFVSLIIFSLSFVSANVLTNLTGYWKFNEGVGPIALDSSTKNNNLTCTNYNNRSFTYGKLNGAFNHTHSGTWTYCESTTGASNWSFGVDPFTVAYWFKVPSGNTTIVHNFGSGWADTEGWSLYLLSTGAVRVTGNAADKFTSSQTGYNDDSWHRLVMSRINESGMRIYVDNSNIGNFTFDNTLSNNLALRVGRYGSGNDLTNIVGLIDDLRIYNNYGWNVTDVSQDYNSGNGQEILLSNVTINSIIYNLTIAETTYESYTINVTLNTSATISTANLIHNNTLYSSSITSLGGSSYQINKQFDTPIGNGTVNLFWNFLLSDGTSYNTTLYSQDIQYINFSLCGSSPQNSPFINFTFKNETIAQQSVPASVTSTLMYWLGSGALNKSFTHTSTSDLASYAYCFNPLGYRMNLIPSIAYYNSYSLQRTYAPGTIALTNSTTNTVLYLLPTSDGIYVTFQVINSAQQSLSGVLINVSRSGFALVESKTTDSSGAATFFLNPNFAYTVTGTKSGYDSFTQSVTPTQSTYTITMTSGSATTNVTDVTRGLSYTIGPGLVYLGNNTYYNFNLSMNSTYWALDSWGYTITNSSGFVLGSNSSTGSAGGYLAINLSTGNNSKINMYVFWTINGSQSNFTKTWIVFDGSQTDFSIARFITDLKTYVGQGMFGLTSFALNLIVFFIIFIFTGVISYKFALTSPAAISGVMAALTVFFDFALDLITYASGIPENTASFLLLLATVTLAIRESYS